MNLEQLLIWIDKQLTDCEAHIVKCKSKSQELAAAGGKKTAFNQVKEKIKANLK